MSDTKPTFYAVSSGTCHVRKVSTQKGRIQRLVNESNGELEFMTKEQLIDRGNEKVTVKSHIDGKEVVIDRRNLGTVNDPSTERYWTM